MNQVIQAKFLEVTHFLTHKYEEFRGSRFYKALSDDRGRCSRVGPSGLNDNWVGDGNLDDCST